MKALIVRKRETPSRRTAAGAELVAILRGAPFGRSSEDEV
jgi:hypothetical protein